MADAHFFTHAGTFRVAEIAPRIGAEVAGAATGNLVPRDVAPESASENELSFHDNYLYLKYLLSKKASAVVVAISRSALVPTPSSAQAR